MSAQLAQALRRIADWSECSAEYRMDFGSNGERDYYRKLAREALAAFEAAPQQAQAPGWQSIETAPKDGSLFMCWVSAVRYGETDEGQQYQQDVSQVDFCSWRTQADIPDCGWFDPCCGQIGDEQGVTHWMPLPAAPQQGSKS